MSFGLKLRLSILVLMLVGVLTAMTKLNQTSVDGFFKSVGMDLAQSAAPSSAATPGTTPSKTGNSDQIQWQPYKLNLCTNRVHSVTWPKADRKIEEYKKGMKMLWQAHDSLSAPSASSVRDINYIQVEKWLTLACDIRADQLIRPANPPAFLLEWEAKMLPFVVIEYIDQSKVQIDVLADLAGGERLFRSNGLIFRSDQLANSLGELAALAAWN